MYFSLFTDLMIMRSSCIQTFEFCICCKKYLEVNA